MRNVVDKKRRHFLLYEFVVLSDIDIKLSLIILKFVRDKFSMCFSTLLLVNYEKKKSPLIEGRMCIECACVCVFMYVNLFV